MYGYSPSGCLRCAEVILRYGGAARVRRWLEAAQAALPGATIVTRSAAPAQELPAGAELETTSGSSGGERAGVERSVGEGACAELEGDVEPMPLTMEEAEAVLLALAAAQRYVRDIWSA